MNLFVYGTLKSNDIFKHVTGHNANYKSAILFGYNQISELSIKKANKEDYVSGMVIDNLTERDLSLIDYYEGIDRLYKRKKVEVKVEGGQKIVSWVYLPQNI